MYWRELKEILNDADDELLDSEIVGLFTDCYYTLEVVMSYGTSSLILIPVESSDV